ncbi:hypothetical protein V1520DRAFT_58007, partial [Lipomyces starkeyi]
MGGGGGTIIRTFTTTKNLKPLQVRWAERLSPFDFIEHTAGDGPSRRPDYRIDEADHPQEFLRFANLQLAALTLGTDVDQEYRHARSTDELAIEMREKKPTGWEETDGILLHEGRIYIPATLRTKVIQRTHDGPLTGHMGQKRTL